MFIQDDLATYYREQGIAFDQFRCIRCARTAGPREARAGDQYLSGSQPRILIVGADTGEPDPGRFEVMDVPAAVEDLGPKNLHWYRTHLLAAELLQAVDPSMSVERVRRYIAITNAAKCCEIKDDRHPARGEVYQNCWRFLAGEVHILMPDVIVTQGNRAASSMKACFPDRTRRHFEDLEYWEVSLPLPRRALWLHTYHPTAHYKYWNWQTQQWEKLRAILVGFLKDTPLESRLRQR